MSSAMRSGSTSGARWSGILLQVSPQLAASRARSGDHHSHRRDGASAA